MGAKLEEKVLKSIAQYRQRTGRFLLNFGQKVAAELIPYLSETGGIEKIAAAGSLRRGKETIGDLDLLVTGPGARRSAGAIRRSIPRRTTCSAKARTRPAFNTDSKACRWICARFRTKATARPCSISRAARNTTSSCAAAR